MTWWLARSMAGSLAGFVAGLLMAVSASSILESTFIWNPNIVALFSAIALSATWQAHRTGQARWWVLAAAGLLVTMQAHVLGLALAPPLVVAYLLDLRGRPPGEARRRLLRAGLVAIVILLLGYVPLLVHELGNNFSETRAAIAFLQAGGGSRSRCPCPPGCSSWASGSWPGRWPACSPTTSSSGLSRRS